MKLYITNFNYLILLVDDYYIAMSDTGGFITYNYYMTMHNGIGESILL